MSLRDKLKPVFRFLKTASVWGGTCLFVTYLIRQTYKSVTKIVNTNVLDREKKFTSEYIYIDDPLYSTTLMLEQDIEGSELLRLTRIWKSLKHSLAWRLLWLCRHGNKDQRNVALERLASFKNNKIWDCLKLAQAMDKNTAVLLARTQGADLRYFLPPPIHIRRAALTPELLSFKFKDMINSLQSVNPHSCIQHFLNKYFTIVQDQAMEADSIPTKPDSISERDLCMQCLDAIHHHISLFYCKDFREDCSTKTLITLGILPRLAELMLRYPNDTELELAILRILIVLSMHTELLKDFFENGLIRDLSRLLRLSDVRVSSSAAICLANLSGEFSYGPGLYLLHPLYRTTTSQNCDILLVHGLRGGVFVTWRQRDKKCAEPIGIMDVTISDVECDACIDKSDVGTKFLDPDFKQAMEDLIEFEDETLLSDLEVVLHDIPIESKRETANTCRYTANKKLTSLKKEEEDRCNYTFCWPKDWLPKDCSNLRVLGVNYWSTLSEWVERCPLQAADITSRAVYLAPVLSDAEVGKNTPIVWLAHSMGGLIVKQLLVDASKSEDNAFKKLSDNTKAVIFYSTPHKGSSLATMPRAAAAVLWPSNDVRLLRENSPTLLDLNKSFIQIADKFKWETVSFAETLPTLVTTFKVPVHFVESVSADLGRGAFYQLPLDHLCICKPATRQSILYTTVLDVLQRATSKDLESENSNLVKWVLDNLTYLFYNAVDNKTQNLDDSHNSFKWFEKVLLETFTDGFTE